MGIRDYIKDQINNEEVEEKKILGENPDSTSDVDETEDTSEGTDDFIPPVEDKKESTTLKKGSEPEAKGEDTESVEKPEQGELFQGLTKDEKKPRKTVPDNGKGSVEEEIFDLQGVKGRIKFGDKVMTLEELRNGVMFQDDYTRKRQYYKPIEEFVNRLRSNPAELVKYAMENGLSKEELIRVLGVKEPEAKKIEEEKMPEFETEIEKKMYLENRVLRKDIEAMRNMIDTEVIPGIRKSERMSQTFAQANEIKRFSDGFDAFAGQYQVPDNAKFMVKLLLDRGQQVYGKDYTIEAAMSDYKKGQIPPTEFELNKWMDEHPDELKKLRDEWTAESDKQKSDIRRRTITPDSVGGGSQPPAKREGDSFRSPREAAEAYKRKQGFIED